MQPSSILLAVAFFSVKAYAQFEELLSTSTLLQDPDVSSEFAQLPSSVVSHLASAIPKAQSDILGYISTLVSAPPFASAASKLNPILPNDEKSRLAGDPAHFVYNLITATTAPVWITAVPSDLVGYFERVDDDVRSIVSNEVTIPAVPRPTLEPRPGSSRTSLGPISSSAAVATTTLKTATNSASTVTTAPAGTGVPTSSGSGVASATGSGTGRIITPTTPSNPSVTPFNSASPSSRWGGMIGAAAALMAVGVGALLLA